MRVKLTRRGLLLGSAGLAGGLLLPVPASWASAVADADDTTRHALIVAVTRYPQLPARFALTGPNNDCELVREFLVSNARPAFPAGNVTVLADGLPGAAEPTRAAIRAAMADLAGRVEPGDFVYLHFSGHGAQQPAMEPEAEIDGKDEIFLPMDTGLWVDQRRGVPNAYVDKEIGADLEAIRKAGAFVWAVFDCCHSGTITRDASLLGADEVERKIDFEALIAEGAQPPAAAVTRSAGAAAVRRGTVEGGTVAGAGMVAFFASQTVETTPEMLLPQDRPEAARQMGLFTHTLLSKLAETPAVTYRQLGQAVHQAYLGMNRSRPTPLFEGDLDRPVFGGAADLPVAQWPIETDYGHARIPAGLMHRVSEGARLAVLAGPGDALDEALGFVAAAGVQQLSSRIVALDPTEADDDMPAMAIADIPEGAFARLLETTVEMTLSVALPPPSRHAAAAARVVALLESLASDEAVALNLQLVEAGAPADVRLSVMSERDGAGLAGGGRDDDGGGDGDDDARLWLLPPDARFSLAAGRRPPSLALDEGRDEVLRQRLQDVLVRVFRAANLARLAAFSEFHGPAVSVGLTLQRFADGAFEEMEPQAVPLAMPRDRVVLAVDNGSAAAIDVNVVYVGSDYSITHMYMERFHSGDAIELPILEFTDVTFGHERIFVVLSEGREMTPVLDLGFLAQAGLRMGAPVGARPDGLGGLLSDLAMDPGTRSAAPVGSAQAARGAIFIYGVETAPRADG